MIVGTLRWNKISYHKFMKGSFRVFIILTNTGHAAVKVLVSVY